MEPDGILTAGKFLFVTVYLGSISVGEAASLCTLKPLNGLTPSAVGTVCICFPIAIVLSCHTRGTDKPQQRHGLIYSCFCFAPVVFETSFLA